jgi:glycosyltransferase involved in cell wall biosynthesis
VGEPLQSRLLPGLRVHVADPPAYTPPYDHALCAALADAGADVTLVTTEFPHGEVPQARGYRVDRRFYRHRPRRAGLRRVARLAQHVPDMLAYRGGGAGAADVVHFQWLSLQPLDAFLLPRGRPLVLTAHDVLPREPRPGQREGQKRLYERVDAVVVHSEHGARRLEGELEVDPRKVHIIPHGPLADLAEEPVAAALPAELREAGDGPIALCFGLMRPYKGIDVLLQAWREAEGALPPGARLWMVGMPRMDVSRLRAASPASVEWVPRFVSRAEAAAVFRRADLAVLPYREIDQSGVLFTALALQTPLLVTAVGGFPELARTGAAAMVAPGDSSALARELADLLASTERRATLAAAGLRATAPDGPYGWASIARRTLDVYEDVVGRLP